MSDYTPTAAEITVLRRFTGEYPAENSAYTDEELTSVLAEWEGDVHAAAYNVWMWKAAAVSNLFDWSADGGSYKQAQLYDRYKANAEAELALSDKYGGNLVDPTLKPVEE